MIISIHWTELPKSDFFLGRYIHTEWQKYCYHAAKLNISVSQELVDQEFSKFIDPFIVKHNIDILYTRNNILIVVLSDTQHTLLQLKYAPG